MKITPEIVTKLIKVIGSSLYGSAGTMTKPGTFCVQQAVSKAIGEPHLDDSPTPCVSDELIKFGINLNDRDWPSNNARARGLKRFAVAELGSRDHVNPDEFDRLVADMWNKKYEKKCWYASTACGVLDLAPDAALAEVAEMAVQALKKLKTPGSKFLFLCGRPKLKAKPDKHVCKEVKRTEWREFKPSTHGKAKQLA